MFFKVVKLFLAAIAALVPAYLLAVVVTVFAYTDFSYQLPSLASWGILVVSHPFITVILYRFIQGKEMKEFRLGLKLASVFVSFIPTAVASFTVITLAKVCFGTVYVAVEVAIAVLCYVVSIRYVYPLLVDVKETWPGIVSEH